MFKGGSNLQQQAQERCQLLPRNMKYNMKRLRNPIQKYLLLFGKELNQSVTFIKILTQMNMRIYLYISTNEWMNEWISEYIRTSKFYTNKCQNRFVSYIDTKECPRKYLWQIYLKIQIYLSHYLLFWILYYVFSGLSLFSLNFVSYTNHIFVERQSPEFFSCMGNNHKVPAINYN